MTNLKDKIESQIKQYKSIGFFDTKENNIVWDAFLQFCKLEADNNYLLGIKMLLQSYSTDWKYNSLYNEIQELKIKVSEQQEVNPVVSKQKTFGKKVESEQNE